MAVLLSAVLNLHLMMEQTEVWLQSLAVAALCKPSRYVFNSRTVLPSTPKMKTKNNPAPFIPTLSKDTHTHAQPVFPLLNRFCLTDLIHNTLSLLLFKTAQKLQHVSILYRWWTNTWYFKIVKYLVFTHNTSCTIHTYILYTYIYM